MDRDVCIFRIKSSTFVKSLFFIKKIGIALNKVLWGNLVG